MRELFVYYRIPAERVAAAKVAVRAMQEDLRRTHPRLEARLLVRHDPAGGDETWMETYAVPGTSDGLDGDLEARIAAAALPWAGLIDGTRHVEAFDAMP